LIDQDNLKKDESVGTFRWNDSIKLINIPRKFLLETNSNSFQARIQIAT